jgi:hypothetical protein
MADDGATFQSVFTVVAPVRPERVAALRTRLETVAADPAENDLLPLGRLPGLHYSSLVLFPGGPDRDALLVFEANVDAAVREHLGRVVDVAAVDEIWGHCDGFPTSGGRAEWWAWLESHVVLPGAYHVGAVGRSRDQIERELRLRGAIEEFLDSHRDGLPATAVEIRQRIQAHVRSLPDLAWALSPPADRPGLATTGSLLLRTSDRTVVPPVLLGLAVTFVLAVRRPATALLGLAAAVGGFAGWLRWRETTDAADDHPVPDAHLDAIEANEDRPGVLTNHLASLADVKPGFGRRTLLRIILLVIDVAARTTYTKGELGGIPSIHFAHWSIVDRGRRLLFVSNYDGSWESYLDDFIDKAASGLTAVWSNTIDFPACEWLGVPDESGGARRGPEFKRVARNSQSPTTIHFRAYPALSVPNVLQNSALRRGLVGDMTEEEALTWLSHL